MTHPRVTDQVTDGASFTSTPDSGVRETEAGHVPDGQGRGPETPNDSGTFHTVCEAAVRAGAPAVPNAQRSVRGRFLPGHTENRSHGLDSLRVPDQYAAMSARFLEQSVTDDGGLSEIPARRLSQHEYRALVHRKICQLNDALEARGLCDKRGKLRVAWLQRLEAMLTLATRIDSTLGLQRRTKTVADPADWLEGKA